MALGCRRTTCETRCAVDGATDAAHRSGLAQGIRLVAGATTAMLGAALVTLAGLGSSARAQRRAAYAVTVMSRVLLRVLGIRVTVDGRPRSGPGLVVANHVSWLDLLVLSAGAPMRQVAKVEVASWPVLGPVARRSGALFLRRDSWSELPGLVDAMTTALRQGAKVQVFPEATTRCGGALGEFRRAAFQAAIDAAVVVLPATLSYRDHDGRQTAAPAFVGDETLIASIRRTVAVTGLEITVRWLSPIPAIAGTGQWARDRANVARGVELAVARDLGVPVVRRRSSASQPQKDPVRTGPTRG